MASTRDPKSGTNPTKTDDPNNAGSNINNERNKDQRVQKQSATNYPVPFGLSSAPASTITTTTAPPATKRIPKRIRIATRVDRHYTSDVATNYTNRYYHQDLYQLKYSRCLSLTRRMFLGCIVTGMIRMPVKVCYDFPIETNCLCGYLVIVGWYHC